MLSLKGHISKGSRVQSLQGGTVGLKGFGGQHFETKTSILSIRNFCRNGVVVEDAADAPALSESNTRVFGMLIDPSMQFRTIV